MERLTAVPEPSHPSRPGSLMNVCSSDRPSCCTEESENLKLFRAIDGRVALIRRPYLAGLALHVRGARGALLSAEWCEDHVARGDPETGAAVAVRVSILCSVSRRLRRGSAEGTVVESIRIYTART